MPSDDPDRPDFLLNPSSFLRNRNENASDLTRAVSLLEEALSLAPKYRLRSHTLPTLGSVFIWQARPQNRRKHCNGWSSFSFSSLKGHLWVSQCVITYDGVPAYSLSVMEIADGLVTHETQYFADPFQASADRAALAEPIPADDR